MVLKFRRLAACSACSSAAGATYIMSVRCGLGTTRTAVRLVGALLISCLAAWSTAENDTVDSHSRAIDLCREGRLDDAWTLFQDAVVENPLHAGAWHSLGNLAIIMADFESGIRYHHLGKAADPSQVPPLALLHQNKVPCGGLGDTFFVSSFAKKRLFDQPNDTETQFDVHVSMGTQLEDSGLPDLAMRHFTKAAELRPERTELKLRNALMVPVVYENTSHVASSRRQLEAEVAHLLQQAAAGTLRQLDRLDQLALPGTFYLVYQGFADAGLMRDIHAVYAHLYPRLSPPVSMAPTGREQAGRTKIRVGFVSAYLRRHSVGKLFAGIIAKLPRKHFEVVVFSSTARTDDVTQLAASGSTVVPMPRGFLLSNRDTALQQDLDVIVYTDIGMDTPTTMWASARLAPIQVVTWGHPVTTGLPHMDYFVSSDLYEEEEPGERERYTEQMVRLSSLGFHFKDPSPDAIPSPAPSLPFLHKYGLPTDRPIISCLQFHPSFDTALASILAALPTAVLVLVYPPSKAMWRNKLADRFDRTLRAPGRVVWLANVPPTDFLSLLAHSHVSLDPSPFGGGVTTLEALSVCSPVVTLPSAQTVPTLAAGMLRAMGGEVLRPLIAETEEQYVEAAVRLASNATWRAEVSREICHRKHVLYSSKEAVREWAAFFKRAMAGLRSLPAL